MNSNDIQRLLEAIAAGKLSPRDAMEQLRNLPFEDLGIGKIDHHRVLRNSFSEVIFCQGKAKDHVARLVSQHAEAARSLFCTRVPPELGEHLVSLHPQGDYDEVSRTFQLIFTAPAPLSGTIAILCAGTADLPTAEEARRTAQFFGAETVRYYDVGVAGLPRLLSVLEEMRRSSVAIVVAGMEGALPSVVAGLISIPIIACPTSIGYGVHLQGFVALFGMLGSCAEGISVVNIDNGFGAACAALRILRGFTSNAS